MECDDRDKISVSCLDLTYSITYKITKTIKDESKDETNIVALLDIPTEELEEEGEKLTIIAAGLIELISKLEKYEAKKSSGLERVKQTFRHVSGYHIFSNSSWLK